MELNINLKGNQGHNVESDKPLNQSLQSDSEKIGHMSSNGLPWNCCKVLNEHIIGHVLEGQKGGSTIAYIRLPTVKA